MTEFVIVSLILLLIGSNVFWAHLCLKLTNRIMSRNYAELKQADKKPAPRKPELVLPETDEYAESQASGINSLLGMV